MRFTVSEIAQMLDGNIVGDENTIIDSAAKIEEGRPGCISFLANTKYEPYIYTTKSSAVIVNKDFVPKKEVETTLIYVENAYTAFTVLLEEYNKRIAQNHCGVEDPSFIGDNVTVGEDCYRGAFSYIGKNSTLGNHVKVYPHAFIGDNVTLGDHTIVHSGARIYSNTVIGNHCTIFANAVIGTDGFGFAPQADGTYKTIPQLGNVLIEDYVSVGANTTIDCATMGSTIIRSGVKIDNLVQIAHNVEIGKNTVIAAQAGISGSTTIGENCVIAGQVGVVGHITVANHTKVGAQSGLSKSVKREGQSMSGSPARELNDHLRSLAHIRKLPELEERLKELEGKQVTTDFR